MNGAWLRGENLLYWVSSHRWTVDIVRERTYMLKIPSEKDVSAQKVIGEICRG